MNMILVTLAVISTSPDFDNRGYPTPKFRDQVAEALSLMTVAYGSCAKDYASRVYRGSDSAPVIAEAALGSCSKYEAELIELNATSLAVRTSVKTGFDFKMLYETSQRDRVDLWKPSREKLKSIVVSHVLELRAKNK